MEYAAKYSVPSPTADTYDRYLGVTRSLRRAGCSTTTTTSSSCWAMHDTFAIDDFRAVLRKRLGPHPEERVTYPPIGSIDRAAHPAR